MRNLASILSLQAAHVGTTPPLLSEVLNNRQYGKGNNGCGENGWNNEADPGGNNPSSTHSRSPMQQLALLSVSQISATYIRQKALLYAGFCTKHTRNSNLTYLLLTLNNMKRSIVLTWLYSSRRVPLLNKSSHDRATSVHIRHCAS